MAQQADAAPRPVAPVGRSASHASEPFEMDEVPIGEPVLTSDELRALLQDQPLIPPYNAAD
jgi:hypothetical protein